MSDHMLGLRIGGMLVAALFLIQCSAANLPPAPTSSAPSARPTESSAAPASPIDPSQPPAIAGQGGYNYKQVATADFDADGIAEQAFLIANAEVVDGKPLWDDGHSWQLYIEEPTGERTYLFARFVQLGRVDVKLGELVSGEKPHILVLEQWPMHFNVYDIVYREPQAFDARLLVAQELAQFPDGFALDD